MNARSVASRLAGLISMVWLATPAHAVVESFSFVSGSYSISGETTPIDAGIAGTFSGSVESNGFMELGDLTAFEATVHFANGLVSLSGPLDLSDLSLFSYSTSGGASSLSLVGVNSSPDISGIACMGAPAALDPA